MKHIVCFHLLNDYSGSPKVLGMVLDGLLRRGFRVDLVTSSGGVLDELRGRRGLTMHGYSYSFSRNAAVTALRYAAVQFYTFLLAFRWLFSKDTVFYINTILPVGPALAGRLAGKRVVYHYHENAFGKGGFYRALARMMEKLANEIICVSAYQASFLRRRKNVTVIPNSLPQDFVERLRPSPEAAFERKTVLMLGSLKLYKGPLEFMELAGRLTQYSFELIVNCTQTDIDTFLEEYGIVPGKNLTVYSRQNDVAPFYNGASLVLNLSNRGFVETFGLTALEAMSAGLPVIVPTVGGIAEMVEDGVNGYKIDVQETDRLTEQIRILLTDRKLYLSLAEGALKVSKTFGSREMMDRIMKVLEGM